MKKIVVACIIILSFVILLCGYDNIIGKKIIPHFFKAPASLCSGKYIGITLPPLGIWICPEYYNDIETIRHELGHWKQYKQFGTGGFYFQYIIGWIVGGFTWENNWMEIEVENNIAR